MHPKDRAQMMAYLTRPAMARGGRAKFEPGGVVTKKELTNVLGKAGVVINPNNFAAGAKDLGIKQNTKDPDFNRYNPKYIEPTKKQLKKNKSKTRQETASKFSFRTGKRGLFIKRKTYNRIIKRRKINSKWN